MSASAEIRDATPQDLPHITRIYNDAVLTTIGTFDLEIKTEAEQKNWFDVHGGRHPVLVAVENNEVAGYASLNAFSDRCGYQDTAEISVYVDPKHRGKQWGTRLLAELIERAKTHRLDCLVSRISEGNEASFVIHRKFGFFEAGVLKKVGKKFGRVLDVHYWQLLLS